MSGPSSIDWSFAEVAKVKPARATRLELAPAFETIVAEMGVALADALARKSFRCGTDFFRGHQRAIVQFLVPSKLYDCFFNSRRGYRAQYWIAPEQGQAANAECLRAAWSAMEAVLPERFEARKIDTENHWTGRKDIDVGGREALRSFYGDSFGHPAAKVWMCERLIRGHNGPLQSIPIFDAPRLVVDRWPTALAHCPDAGLTWLDLKGGFVGGEQPKDPWLRAVQINKHGFS